MTSKKIEPNQSGEHLTAAQLDAYRQGVLPAMDAEKVKDHLSRCQECADWLLDVAAGEQELPSGVASNWDDLQTRIQADGTNAGDSATGSPDSGDPATGDPEEERETERIELVQAGPPAEIVVLRRQLQRTRSAAALLTLGLLLSLVWRQLDRTPSDLAGTKELSEHTANQVSPGDEDPDSIDFKEPLTNLSLVRLDPVSQPVRSSGNAAELAPNHQGFYVMLPIPDMNDWERRFQLKMVDPNDNEIWQAQGVFASGGMISVAVPNYLIREIGRYRFELQSFPDGEPVEQYDLQIDESSLRWKFSESDGIKESRPPQDDGQD